MKKKVWIYILALIIVIGISALFVYSPKSETVYELKTELGDSLSIEVIPSEDSSYMYYTFCGEGFPGSVYISEKGQNVDFDDPMKSFKTIGTFGNTHFYSLNYKLIYIYNNECIGVLAPSAYALDRYKARLLQSTEETDKSIKALNEALVDMIKIGNFDYIYQFGEILAFRELDEMELLLERYAMGDFTEEELLASKDSSVSNEDITNWAQKLLLKYYSS